jgi:hypothetical protein
VDDVCDDEWWGMVVKYDIHQNQVTQRVAEHTAYVSQEQSALETKQAEYHVDLAITT